MFSNQLSAQLLKIINERGLTIESLAALSGLTREYMSNITNCKQVPTLTSFEKICSALELEPNDLLISDKSKNKEKSKAMRVDTVYCQRKGSVYSYVPVCPCCNSLLQNDWQSYCEYCGQRLSWERYIDSKVVMEKPCRKKQ